MTTQHDDVFELGHRLAKAAADPSFFDAHKPAIIGGASGLALGALAPLLMSKRKNKVRNSILGALTGGMLGAAGGEGYSMLKQRSDAQVAARTAAELAEKAKIEKSRTATVDAMARERIGLPNGNPERFMHNFEGPDSDAIFDRTQSAPSETRYAPGLWRQFGRFMSGRSEVTTPGTALRQGTPGGVSNLGERLALDTASQEYAISKREMATKLGLKPGEQLPVYALRELIAQARERAKVYSTGIPDSIWNDSPPETAWPRARKQMEGALIPNAQMKLLDGLKGSK